MTSLEKFPALPPAGTLAVCEVEGKVQSAPAESANVDAFTSAICLHPKIFITRELLHHAPALQDESGRIFVPVQGLFLKRMISSWYESGFAETLEVAANLREGEGPRLAVYLACCLLKMANIFTKIRNAFHPHLRESGERLIAAVSQTREWSLSPVRCIEWHPHASKLAVATWDDSVRIYSSDSQLTPILKCKDQTSISCLAWRPFSCSELAVGCHLGVFLWIVDPNSVMTRPSMSCGQILKQPSGHKPVTSVVWSPQGDLLLTSSAADTCTYLWDVAMERNVPLKRVGGGGVCLLAWSPDSSKLFAATAGVVFRVWKTEKWIPERWTTMSGRVQTACWSPCGSVILFATTEEPLVYALPFDAVGSVFQSDELCNASPVIDLTSVEVENSEERVGGLVTAMEWDKRGRHLAIVFKDSSVLAVFRTEIKTVFKITPCCFISGLPGEAPSAISFQKNFTEGALLTIAWSSGRLQHFPFVYTDLEAEENLVPGFRSLSNTLNSPRLGKSF